MNSAKIGALCRIRSNTVKFAKRPNGVIVFFTFQQTTPKNSTFKFGQTTTIFPLRPNGRSLSAICSQELSRP